MSESYYEEYTAFNGEDLDAPDHLRTRTEQHPLYDPLKMDAYLNQTKVWIDAKRHRHVIKDMEDRSDLFNILNYLRNHAEQMSWARFLIFTDAPDEVVNEALTEPSVNNPITWVESTPLYQRIRRRYTKLTRREQKRVNSPF